MIEDKTSTAPSLDGLRRELSDAANPEYAKTAAWFFKTGKGEYGEGDVFIGVRVPAIRAIVKGYMGLSLDDIGRLVRSEIHEERLSGMLLLVMKYKSKKATDTERKVLYDYYIDHADRINNWDLVDLSAPSIAGDYLFSRDRSILKKLARSKCLWERRISIIATQEFIRRGDFSTTLEIAALLLGDTHDLIHKAVGWMLREVGKRDMKTEESFLAKHYRKMPRTMLRYAIEKFPEKKRKRYLEGKI
jgi:3-methyladenine DNA glycosylase AlkD